MVAHGEFNICTTPGGADAVQLISPRVIVESSRAFRFDERTHRHTDTHTHSTTHSQTSAQQVNSVHSDNQQHRDVRLSGMTSNHTRETPNYASTTCTDCFCTNVVCDSVLMAMMFRMMLFRHSSCRTERSYHRIASMMAHDVNFSRIYNGIGQYLSHSSIQRISSQVHTPLCITHRLHSTIWRHRAAAITVYAENILSVIGHYRVVEVAKFAIQNINSVSANTNIILAVELEFWENHLCVSSTIERNWNVDVMLRLRHSEEDIY